MFSKFILRSIFLLLPLWSFAQTGPGGVGNASDNGLWLRASDVTVPAGSPVVTWPDVSGNGNDGGQSDPTMQPLFFNTSSMNGQPIVRLDGADDLVVIPDDPMLDGSTGMTYFAVLRPNNLDNSSARGILGKRITFTVSNDYSYTWFFWTNNRLYADINTQNNRFNTSNSFSNATNYILSFDYNGNLPANERTRLYNAGEVIRVANESSGSIINSTQDLVLGALNKNYRSHFSVDYAEVIQYNYSLNDAEHIIVHNYLSAKYNIPLANDLIYDEDDATNGNFDLDVAGIGFIDATNQHRQARGTGFLEISNPSNMNSEKFLLWGSDNGAMALGNSANQPSTVQSRLGRTWRASEVNRAGNPVDVGSITMRWDLSGVANIDVANLRLLIDTNNDGSFVDETPISGAASIGGGIYEFANITGIANNTRFTLASTQTTALPVELGAFTVEVNNQRTVDLAWSTYSELNSAYFEIERSADAISWATIDRVASAGDSKELLRYQAMDAAPLKGWSYYRLKQVDLDGTFTYSDVRAVELLAHQAPLRLYPNPIEDYLFVEGEDLGKAPVRIFTSSGAEVTTLVGTQQENSDRLRLDLRALPAGLYILQTPNSVRQIQKR